ncbi:MAG: flagellar basal-body rod protein FlgC [Planctomycetota bacterium]|jgi:flagellar basal-body rod protein FlgC
MSGISQLFSGMRISSSGMMAERVRIDTIAENIANVNTTRTASGEPYRRKMVEFAPILEEAGQFGQAPRSRGVRAVRILEDTVTPFEEILDPSHAHADENGRVLLPNVNAILEMTDMVTAMRAYEANLTAQEGYVRMAERALQLAR